MVQLRKAKNQSKRIVLIFIVVCCCLVLGILLYSNREAFQNFGVTKNLVDLWNAGDFATLYTTAQSTLDKEPFNSAALQFYGFSAFMLGYWHPDAVEKKDLLQESVTALRRLMLLNGNITTSEQTYMLGKAYFHLQNYDRSLEYLERSYVHEQHNEDLNEYLVTLYDITENGEKLSRLVAEGELQGEIQGYALARAAMLEQKFTQAIEAFRPIASSAENALVKRLSGIHLARIYAKVENFEAAKQILLTLIDSNPVDGEALHLLGDVYKALEGGETARYYWREALRIEPENDVILNKLRATS